MMHNGPFSLQVSKLNPKKYLQIFAFKRYEKKTVSNSFAKSPKNFKLFKDVRVKLPFVHL